MCMEQNFRKTSQFKKANKTGKKTYWKVLKKDCGYPVCDVHSLVFDHKWHPGWNRSNAKPRKEPRGGFIYEGIHVFRSVTQARSYGYGLDEVVVPVECYNKDLIAIGQSWADIRDSGKAVYTKVFLKKADYDKAVKGNK